MLSKIRWRRVLRNTLIAAVTFLAAIAICIQAQQHQLRWRAERLLADIRQLQMDKSTWADAQRLMTRWGSWGKYEGTCSEQRCSYQIELDDLYGTILAFDKRGSKLADLLKICCMRLWRPYELLGGRTEMVVGRFEVIEGVIRGKDFVLGIEVHDSNAQESWDYLLFGSATTAWRTGDFGRPLNIAHPEYVIGRPGGCEGCENIYAKYTPYADPNEVNKLLDFNLDCLTQLISCRHPADIMPSVWKRYQIEEAIYESAIRANPESAFPCAPSLEFLGRDRANVVVAKVDSVQSHDDQNLEIDLHLVQRLKRTSFWKDDEIRKIALADPKVKSNLKNGIGSLKLGMKLILAFSTPMDASNRRWVDDASPCGVLPLTPENLAAIQRGIQQDIFPEGRNVFQ
ncbi:MAG TPA: hypothetical protein VHZ52_16925 [Acidobacteriaceae bacterium]|jgi:hypothetical protein|nr:hypothetical protein [Acidobacteriaceae bacterium]